jgi:hypothetical protein
MMAGYMMTSIAVLGGITFFTSQYQEANGLFYVYQVMGERKRRVESGEGRERGERGEEKGMPLLLI